MSESPTEPPELPPRPPPPRRSVDLAGAWLAWFGPVRAIVTALSVVAVCAGGYWLVRAPSPPTEAGLPVATGSPTSTLAPPVATPATEPERPAPVVHVAGAVAGPGVYRLAAGARVHTAIEAAGGAAPDADLDGLNLAAPVVDGQRIYVPVVGEIDPVTLPDGPPPGAEPQTLPSDGPLDLNRATAAELEALPGIGPATAAAIVDDRTRHGPFASVDDLDRVPGIGPAKLGALRDLVSV